MPSLCLGRHKGVDSVQWVAAVVIVMVGTSVSSADRYHPALRLGGAPNQEELSPKYWARQAAQAIKERTSPVTYTGVAKNVILFLGDGMSIATLTAARIYLGQKKGRTGEEAELFFESFPTTGLVKTYCANSQVADSACTATSYLCGVKVNIGCIGVSAAVRRGDCAGAMRSENQLQSVAQWALADGRDVGLVTTTRVTHASPAGMYAHVADRSWEYDGAVRKRGHNSKRCLDIAHQLVHMNPGSQFKVILGGGRRNFLPTNVTDEEGFKGVRNDSQNLIDIWKRKKANMNATHKYIWNRNQLMEANNNLPEYLLGLFESSHLKFHLETNAETEPTLAELTETAIKMLSRNSKGFFLFVEGGRIDHGHHENRVHKALEETVQFSMAVKRAYHLVSPSDSLLVVTSDHAHVMTLNGYSNRGHNILGPSRSMDAMKMPYMTLSYSNGPGYYKQTNGKRTDVTKDEKFGTVNWRSHVDVPLLTETHGGDDVAVFALGPNHAMFSGLYEQSQLPYRMAWVGCFGPSRDRCAAQPDSLRQSAHTFTIKTHWCYLMLLIYTSNPLLYILN